MRRVVFALEDLYGRPGKIQPWVSRHHSLRTHKVRADNSWHGSVGMNHAFRTFYLHHETANEKLGLSAELLVVIVARCFNFQRLSLMEMVQMC